jgi:hypothetical protein
MEEASALLASDTEGTTGCLAQSPALFRLSVSCTYLSSGLSLPFVSESHRALILVHLFAKP